MGKRLRVLGIFAIIGFILGAAVNFIYFEVLPTLIEVFPQIFGAQWVLWGFAGASLSVLGCLIYAMLPEE